MGTTSGDVSAPAGFARKPHSQIANAKPNKSQEEGNLSLFDSQKEEVRSPCLRRLY